jgi:hypothetical protein
MMNSNVERLANHGLHHRFPVFLPQTLLLTSLAISSKLMTLARFRHGRILPHLLAMLSDRCIRFHVAGIVRELPGAAG